MTLTVGSLFAGIGGYSEHSHNADSCEGCVDERPNMSHHGFLSVEDATDYLLRDCLTFCDHSANPKWSGIHEWSCFVPAPIEAITDGKVLEK